MSQPRPSFSELKSTFEVKLSPRPTSITIKRKRKESRDKELELDSESDIKKIKMGQKGQNKGLKKAQDKTKSGGKGKDKDKQNDIILSQDIAKDSQAEQDSDTDMDEDDTEENRSKKIMLEAARIAVSEATGNMSILVNNAMSNALMPLKESMKDIADRTWQTEQDIRDLKTTVTDIQDNLDIEKIKKDVKADIRSDKEEKNSIAHKLYLVNAIEKSSCNLIIHGLKTSDNIQSDVENLLSSIGMTDEMINKLKIKNCFALGKQDGNRPASVMMSLGSSHDRTEVLKNAKNLPKGIYFKKDIPSGYREKSKEFERKAYKLRSFMGVQTQVSFANHVMQIRYRDNSSKAFTVHEEFYPSPQECFSKQKGNFAEEGSPSKSVNTSTLEVAKRSFIISNLKDIRREQAVSDIGERLDEGEMYEHIEEVQVNERFTLVRCINVESMEKMITKCRVETIGEEALKCEIFDPPTIRQGLERKNKGKK